MATPSHSANASTSTPISSVRGSRQAASTEDRLAAADSATTGGRNARTPESPASRIATTVTASCHSSETPAFAQPAPISAPSTVPRLKPAWKRGITVRPSRRSTSAPSTFIATSHVLVPTPYNSMPSATAGTAAPASPTAITSRPTDPASTPAATVRAGPSRPTTRPDSGSAVIVPADTDSNSRPTRPGVRPRVSRMAGTRATHEAKASPFTTKITLTPTFARCTA